MTKSKLSKILDTIFVSFITFLVSLVWIRFYFKNSTLAYILSSLITIIVLNVYILAKFRKNKKITDKKLRKQSIDDFNNYLLFLNDNDKLNILYNILQKRNKVLLKENYFIIDGNKKTILYCNYNFSKLNNDDILHLYKICKENKCEKLVITSLGYEKECNLLSDKLKDININLIDSSTFYNEVVLPSEFKIPDSDIKKNLNKISFKEFLNVIFSRKKTKSYFFSSIIILLSSFIVPYNIYYIIIFTILIGLTILSYIYPKFNKKTKEQLF